MNHRDEYMLKKHNRFQISIFFQISFLLFDFEHYEFRISCFKFKYL